MPRVPKLHNPNGGFAKGHRKIGGRKRQTTVETKAAELIREIRRDCLRKGKDLPIDFWACMKHVDPLVFRAVRNHVERKERALAKTI